MFTADAGVDALDADPFDTVTVSVAPGTIMETGRKASNSVALTYVVVRAMPLTWTWEIVTNPEPEMVICTGPAGSAATVFGDMDAIAGVGAVGEVPPPVPPHPTINRVRPAETIRSSARRKRNFMETQVYRRIPVLSFTFVSGQ